MALPGAPARAWATRGSTRQQQPSLLPQLVHRPQHQAGAAAADMLCGRLRCHCITAAAGDAHSQQQQEQQPPARDEQRRSEQQEQPAPREEEAWDYAAPSHVLERNARFVSQRLRGQVLLAPLTRGGNLPFRQLCCSFAPGLLTMSEMAFARQLLKGDRVEAARLKRAASEACFGVQIATNNITEGARAAKMARDAGAAWVDLNCGCPIYEATRRGLGAALLRKPGKLAKLVAGIAAGSELPVTVKVRTGESEKKVNVQRVVALLGQAGAAAVCVHGRTMEQRYKKAADWTLMAQLVRDHSDVPLILNGDILTHYEAADRWQQTGAAALMVGRGALIKPWVFQELRENRELAPSAAERVAIYRQLAALMKGHFGDDAWGKRKSWYFMPWHFEWFSRYRPLPPELYAEQSRAHPLIATRGDLADARLGESEDGLPPLERLLRCEASPAHAAIADLIWEAASDAEAVAQLTALASGPQLAAWEAELRAGRGRDRADDDPATQG